MGRSRVIFLYNEEETRAFGKILAPFLPLNSILALHGDLGAGKTTFVQGLAQGLGIEDPIQSPTFVFVNQYQGNLPLFHFDLYRMKGEDDFLGLGFDEYFDAGGICAVEWPEKIGTLLPSNVVHIYFSYEGNYRQVLIQGLNDDVVSSITSKLKELR